MPTEAEMAEVAEQIEASLGSRYLRGHVVVDLDGKPVGSGEDPLIESRVGSLTWPELSSVEQMQILESNVDWRGFARQEELNVIGSVISGEPPDRWMQEVGITPDHELLAFVESRVVEQIKTLQARTFNLILDGEQVGMLWHQFPDYYMDQLLGQEVDWTGLTPDDQSDVVKRVLEGDGPEHWLDDVRLRRGTLQGVPVDDEGLPSEAHVAHDASDPGSPEQLERQADEPLDWSEVSLDDALRLLSDPRLHDDPAREIEAQHGDQERERYREIMIDQAFTLARDLGYPAFRDQYLDDPASAPEWFRAAAREGNLDTLWSGLADRDSFGTSFWDADIEDVERYRDQLQGPPRGDAHSREAANRMYDLIQKPADTFRMSGRR